MYSFSEIEKKWQKFWKENNTFQTSEDFHKKKAYVLDMFPYPSGAGLHVGHPKGYIATDVLSRYLRTKGYNVLHPMGWDAFGLPAENYAIKTGTHPRVTTAHNIAIFKQQLENLGFSYDWTREIDTTDPKYYKWTQWIFLKLFEAGLAYEQNLPINYCPSCKTGLANEEVTSENTCDRCNSAVERRPIRQWVLRITKYADRLLSDVDKLQWPEGIKEMQRNWIGRSEGTEFRLAKKDDASAQISVYTTRIDTVFGMTYVVIAPDHKDVMRFVTPEQQEACVQYIQNAAGKSDQDRTQGGKEKTGVFTGSLVINPFTNKEVPVWIGDYVLGSYGTGAVMAVPAHDERDFAFAQKMHLPIIQSIDVQKEFCADVWDEAYAQDGKLVQSQEFSGCTSADARQKLTQFAAENGFGSLKVNYKLRDWLFSRQRYWGEPIPLIHLAFSEVRKLPHISDISEATEKNLAYILKRDALPGEKCEGAVCKGCGDAKVRVLIIGGKEFSKIYDGLATKIICDYRLPLELPEVEKYEPAGDGNSPLATVESFVKVQLADNLSGERETNTMPQWGGSCWYYLRYMDPHNEQELVSREKADYWGSVDQYVGGAEHAVLHLLYARFWHKFLFDIGVIGYDEPFAKLASPGLILGPDGNKMSKSKGNVVNPDAICAEHGTDTFRIYEMSLSDFRDPAPWNTDAIIGSSRFLEKAWNAFGENPKKAQDDMKAIKLLHKTIKKVGEDIENFKFNTAITAINILLNEGVPADPDFAQEWKEKLTLLLHPFAPHLSEELWKMLGNDASVYHATWPEFDPEMCIDDEVNIAIQINGKLRAALLFPNGTAKDEIMTVVLENPDIKKWIEGKTIIREVFVPNKLVNIVVKE